MPALPTLPRPPLPAELLPGSLRQRIAQSLADFRIPDFTVPTALARLISRLPQQPPTHALIAALNLALGRILPRDTLAPLGGRHLQMRVLDAGLTLDFGLGERGFRRAVPAAGRKPDLVISATTRDFIALALREEDPDTLFFSRRLRMEGDTDLGLLVKNTLDAVDWDSLKARLGLRAR
ncbi:SCP2 domain-containing protein [Thauera mechernichensis]|uniref:Ubiquinone biosynthesis accessory factor UbiT n=1 Tax=Thauera mechernichensis TaxID=82788 RepID=A0ABW3W8I7_9RHOO|nr:MULTISPECIES: SCP2 sterol-binding domain-containing protein [Thauera]ENO80773.1 sterol-binding domain-containing protein [Thauera sp. 27]MDG3064261.1 SCP2 sterol-binding domain-containing protein [Thauera mechernichensis]